MEQSPFGETGTAPADPGHGLPSWTPRLRVAALLACLAGAVVALLGTNDVFSSGATRARASCAGGALPEVAALAPAGTAALRSAALGVFAGRRGELYEQGAVTSANLFTDAEPHLEPAAVRHAGGGYEVRRWALDAEGRSDDVVVDALHFGDAAGARRALEVAVTARCRRSTSAHPAAFPAGAMSLTWINPDNAYQQDTLFVRGSELYRVSDTPPATGWAVQDAREHARVAATTDVLACALPLAGCDPASVRAAAESAGDPALTGADTSPAWPPDPARARAYVQAVALRRYDVEHTRAVAGARGAGLLQFAPRLLEGCAPAARSRASAWASSPLFLDGTGAGRTSYQSLTALLRTAPGATSVQAAFAHALADGCARRVLEAQIRHIEAAHAGVLLVDLHISPLATAGPSRYGDVVPEGASAQRVSYVIVFRLPHGRALRVRKHEEGFVLAYKRALVVLTVATGAEPLPQAARNYLERALAGRAVARWGY